MTLTPEAIIRLGVEMRKKREEYRYDRTGHDDIWQRMVDAEDAFDSAASEYLAQTERGK